MIKLGENLYKNNVREIIFVHGTAVGNDPLDIFNSPVFSNPLTEEGSKLLKAISDMSLGFDLPDFLHIDLIDKTKDIIKLAIDNTLGDVGNFSPEYVRKFGEAIGHGICEGNSPFVWSSGNTHSARLEGTVRLAEMLAQSIKNKKILTKDRILLIGHSHAGQLFALLTIFLQGSNVADKLSAIINEKGWDDQFNKNLESIKDVFLDFVTMGTPVRYRWGQYSKFRLLPIINHRSNSRLDLKAIYNVEDGDYVQQWGTEGTNLPNIDVNEKNLSDILQNAGFDLSVALSNAAKSASKYPIDRQEAQFQNGIKVVENCLLDYGDKRPENNNDPLYCVQKVFGHGIYTTEEKMQFNTEIIVESFYSDE